MSDSLSDKVDMVCPDCAANGKNPNCPLCRGAGHIRMTGKELLAELLKQVNNLTKMAHTHKKTK